MKMLNAVFAVLLVTATAYACILLPITYSLWPVDSAAASGFISGAGAKPVEPVAPDIPDVEIRVAAAGEPHEGKPTTVGGPCG